MPGTMEFDIAALAGSLAVVSLPVSSLSSCLIGGGGDDVKNRR